MEKKKPTIKERMQYWFDERMSKGTISLIKILLIVTILTILIISIVIFLNKSSEGTPFDKIVWDNFAYAFNAWIPFTEDSENYLFLVPAAFVSLIGILFTSILIGIVSSGLEQKISQLRKGTSLVLESGHIVVLGFYPGEYTLISELIESAAGKNIVIVVAGSIEKDEMEDYIHANISVPRKAKIICRNVDICDPQAIKCCAIQQCKTVVISPTDDETTVKSILATLSVLNGNENNDIKIIASVKSNDSILPKHMLKHSNVLMVQTRDIIARLIARSCTQHGIAGLLDEIFNFKGSEFYVNEIEGISGKSFGEILACAKQGVPVGLIRDKHTNVRPSKDLVINSGDKLIYFAENADALNFDFSSYLETQDIELALENESKQQIVVFGINESFNIMVRELPESVDSIVLVDSSVNEDFECEGKHIAVYKGNYDENSLCKLIADKEHLVLLNSHNQDFNSDKDYSNILRLIKLRDYRGHYGYKYSLTAEMISETSRKLVESVDPIDYIVASDVSSMFIAQIAETPEMVSFIKEILSDNGNEIYLKSQQQIKIPQGEYKISDLRMIFYNNGYIFLGYSNDDKNGELVMNPDADDMLRVSERTLFAVIGEN